MNSNYEIKEIDSKRYVCIKCRGCQAELKFEMKDEPRTVHGACLNCGKQFEVYVEDKNYKK